MKSDNNNCNEKIKEKELQDKEIIDLGKVVVDKNKNDYRIYLLSIIGEIEGHECLPSSAKTT